MQVNDVLLKSIAFLGEPTSDHFAVGGTAFLVGITVDDYDFRYFISARHVVWPIRIWGLDPKPPDGELSIRINRRSGQPKIISTKAYLNDFVPTDLDRKPLADADINSGISVVLPVVEILNFLYLPKLVAERASAIEERRKVVGYREE